MREAVLGHTGCAYGSSVPDAKKSAEEKLRTLVPLRSVINDQLTEVIVLESRDPADAIAQAAERLSVDVICLGTHGPSGQSCWYTRPSSSTEPN